MKTGDSVALGGAGRTSVLLGAGVAAAVAAPWIIDAYTISLARYALVLALLAASAHLLTAVTALPTLGQGAYLGVGAYAAAICGRTVTTSAPIQLAAAITAAALAATVVGAALARTRATTFLILTLAVGELAYTAAEHLTALTGGGDGLSTPPATVLPGLPPLIGEGPTYLYILACTLILTGGLAVLLRSRTGLIWRGIADNEPRMRANGHNPDAHLWAVYVTAAAIAGSAGALLVAAHRFVSPTDLGFDVSALALLAAIIGGRSLLGACAAAIAIIAVRDLVGAELTGHSPLLLGVVFLAAAYIRHPGMHKRLRRQGR